MKNILYGLILLLAYSCKSNETTSQESASDTLAYTESHRPQLHFSPAEKWMNDPNGMVYYQGEYHLFYQHYPGGLVWGPMHWGHAISTDLVHWTHLPIALYPDSLGLIFSGSAVVDEKNTTGFGTKDNPPLVAVFTYHSMEKEKAGETDYQNQGIAYSTDKGRTWTKYEKNPVLKNQGIKDFRDPKVFWHEASKQWVMILAVKDHIEIWASADLKSWTKNSDFGSDYGAHGGVWECPDLFPLKIEGDTKQKWVMLVSINPGGPNGGSATQYFVGDFDGTTFKPDTDKNSIAWIDYGPDNYAGVTWANAPDDRKIFLGWMSNWNYAQEVPTTPWRSAMTVARDLSLVRVNDHLQIKSSIVPEFSSKGSAVNVSKNLDIRDSINVSEEGVGDVSLSLIDGTFKAQDFTVLLSNKRNQRIALGFDAKRNRFFIDRANSGKTNFSKQYPLQLFAPRVLSNAAIHVTIVVDVSSVEVFFDDGITVMTSVFFPDENLTELSIKSNEPMIVDNLSIKRFRSIWNN